jgi:hypothetical protein
MAGIAASALLLLALILMGAASAFAQATGSLNGTVSDANSAVIQGVSVTAKNVATGLTRTAQTDNEGRWSIQVLPTGLYNVSYEKEGFGKGLSENIEVEASVPRTVNVTLQVGGTQVEVVVVSEQPLVQPETATVARQVTGEQLTKVPTSTRSFTGLLSSEAGVSSELSPVAVNGNGNISPSVNGTRTTSTSFTFNGIDVTNVSTNEGSLSDNIAPAPETLSEVKLQTSLYDASTGRSGGGNFQAVTKSGGNTLNGNVYVYLQNKALNANDFFFNKFEIEKPKADRLEAGGTIGGPIVKNRFFFFGGYQYTKAETGFVPTARSFTVLPRALTVLTGERTAANVAAAFNQFNGCTVGTNCLSAADISPVALALLNLRNPVTGGFIIPTPNANARLIGVDRAGARGFQFGTVATGGVATRTLQENNPLVQQLNVEPSLFKQNQLTLRLDGNLTSKDIVSGTFFWAKFPGIDSFPDPSSLASPFSLKRDDKNRTLATSYTRTISPYLINEFRFGYFYLNNTRSLDDPFLEITSASVGITNPAILFDDSPGTARLGHFIGRPGTNMAQFSFGGPNDSFNRRKSQSYSVADNITWTNGSRTLKVGAEYKRSTYDTNLPEEQATEFEKFDSFTQFLTGNATEADTQFGLTDKSFRMNDFGMYITNDFKLGRKLTLNVGARYELFLFPTEKNGRIGNFDFSGFESCLGQSGTLALCDNPLPGFIVPKNVQLTGLANVDAAINVSRRVNNGSTLAKEDLNNIAPRLGVAYAVNDKLVFRGGYGLFYDKPSAAFINTVFSNYPFLREVEITVPNGNVPFANAFSAQSTTLGLNNWLPFRIVRGAGATGGYVIRDSTGVGVDPRGVSTGSALGNIAETFEFRAVDRNLKTPLIQQWNFGGQWEFAKNFVLEARYVGTKGTNLLQAVAFNQGFDLNDPATPDHIFERFNQAYVAAGSPNGPLNSGSTARARGLGRAFGFLNTVTGLIDNNLSAANGTIINFEARVPILGFNVPEALLLQSNASSIYHGGQFSLTRRFANGLQFNTSYTYSKSIDNNSSDPGSTAGSGKPDVPNAGFVVQGDQRDLDANRAVSDFDRAHRFSTSFVWDIPSFGAKSALVKGWQVSGFFQTQSGTPYTIFSPEPEVSNVSQLTNIVRGSGGLYRPGFGRPNICGSSLSQAGTDVTEQAFNATGNICSPLGGFGNLGRNTLRAPYQSRFDVGIVKRTKLTERMSFELGWDVFNVFNRANFGTPDSELGSPDFGKITNTVGGPRVMQMRAKFNF